MVQVKGTKKAKELRRRRTQPAPPIGDALQHRFHQLHLEEGSPQQAVRPAPSQVARQMIWHRSLVSSSSVAPPPEALPKPVQVPEISSADTDEDI